MCLCLSVSLLVCVSVRVCGVRHLQVQKEGCPWTYAVSNDTKRKLRCFDRLKFDRKVPESKRDHEQKLLTR